MISALAIILAILILLIIKASKDLVGALLILIFFLPFERIPTTEVGGFTLKINHIVGFILIIFWLLNRLFYNKKFVKNPISLILLIFVSSMILSTIFAPLRSRALTFLVINIFTILLSVLTVDILRNREAINRVEKVIFASSWVVLIFSIWQFMGDMAGLPIAVTGLVEGYSKITFGFPRIQAFSKEPLYLGNYLLLPISFIMAKVFSKTQKKYTDWFLLFGLIIVFILTLSRGALLGLGVFAIMLALFYPKKIFTPKTISVSIITLVVAFTAVIIGIGLVGPNTQEKLVNRLLVKDYNKSESTVSRLSEGQNAIIDWQEHKFFGVGLGNFGGSRTNYDINDPKTLDIVNDEYLEVLAETGIFGFGTFLILIIAIISRSVYVVRQISKKDNSLQPLVVCLTAGLIGMLSQYFFFSTLGIIHIWVTIGLLVAIQSIALKELKGKNVE
jgi:O-antigen ligase